MRDFGRGFLVAFLGVLVFAASVGCPPSKPAPHSAPDASDAAPAPPVAVNCDNACSNAVRVCSTVDRPTCVDICNRIGQPYAVKLLGARGCPDVGPHTTAPASGPNGR